MIPAFQMIAGMPAPVFPPTRECHYCWRDASAFAEAQVGLTRDLAASDSQMYSGLRLDWIAAAREMTAQKKDCNLRLGNKNKSIIVGTFIDWLCLLPVQYWTHDNW
jgi:hypothetical protein